MCELHRVLGHVSQTAVLEAVKKGLIEGVELDSSSQPEFCEACVKAKAARAPFPTESETRALRYGELVHTDLWGPARTTSLGGAFKQYESWLGRQKPGVRLTKVRSDRGGEYLSREFDKYLGCSCPRHAHRQRPPQDALGRGRQLRF